MTPPAPRFFLQRNVVVAISLLASTIGAVGVTAGCKLTAPEAAEVAQIAAPLCDGLGGIATLEVPGLGFVGSLCQAVADDLAAAETVPAADAGIVVPDGGVLPVKAVRAKILATPGCVPVAIPGDPLKQRACPELHEAVLAASLRVVSRVKAKAAAVAR